MADDSSHSLVADASATNVAGYLYNASRRQRVPRADGGRGTRRRVEIVSAATIRTLGDGTGPLSPSDGATSSNPVNEVVVDDDGEEWDVVPVTKTEATVKKTESGEVKKVGSAEVELLGAKAEPLATSGAMEIDEMPIPGSRPALTAMPQQRRLSREEEAETTLVEQEKAARKSAKVQKVSEKITELLVMIARARCLYRAAMHPLIIKGLLRIQFGGGPAIGSKRNRQDRDSARKKIFAAALKEARALYAESCKNSGAGETLAACWVTLKRDGAANSTSRAVLHLVKALNDRFVLEQQPASTESVDNGAPALDARREEVQSCFSELQPFFLRQVLRRVLSPSDRSQSSKFPLPSPVYFCVLFLSLARATGMQTKLVVCDKGIVFSGVAAAAASAGPASWCWVEVFCPVRQCVLSVNPCAGATTTWNPPHCISVGGDTVLDSTARYVSKYSAVWPHRVDNLFGAATEYYLGALRRNNGNAGGTEIAATRVNRSVLDIITEPLCRDASATSTHILSRERRQLERLMYAETVPPTLTALSQHPLYVLEAKIARYEGIYPKDSTTLVGQVKGFPVYKRSAVHSLRSETGWLRENRQIRSAAEPYKVVPPPPSRPLAAPSRFFGVWQTDPFQPAELVDGQPIPTLANTNWYILLSCEPPAGLVHIRSAGAGRIARKMNVHFAQAVVGYVKKHIARNRPGKWEVVLCGIVVRSSDSDAVIRAHEEYMQLQKEQEAARRRLRAMKWWKVFASRLLATDRLQAQFLDGLRRQ
jgi:xeroderma pigmentosum group C-complementing protein